VPGAHRRDKPKAHGSHSEADRKALADFAAKMKSPPKK
jgi:hypothetical protein